MTTRRPAKTASAALLLASLALAGCGGSAAALKSSSEETLPSTPEGTLAALDRAEGDLRLALGEPPSPAYGQPSAAPPGMVQQPGASPTAAPAPPPAEVQGRAPDASPLSGEDRSPAASSDPCHSACRALASMERATEHLCTLAGSEDSRCESARTRVKSAGERVRRQCPSCA